MARDYNTNAAPMLYTLNVAQERERERKRQRQDRDRDAKGEGCIDENQCPRPYLATNDLLVKRSRSSAGFIRMPDADAKNNVYARG